MLNICKFYPVKPSIFGMAWVCEYFNRQELIFKENTTKKTHEMN